MAQIDMVLTAFIQTRQTIAGPGGDEMHGKVLFDATANGRTVSDEADVKLVVGGTYEVDEVEVYRPKGRPYPFDHSAFAAQVRQYVQGAVGKSGWAIRIGSGTGNVVMIGNVFARPVRFTLQATGDGASW